MTNVQWSQSIKIFEYTDAEEYYKQLAREFLEAAERTIAEKEYFVAVLGGGNTPALINSRIVQLSADYKVDWSKVYVVLSDERWVDEHNSFSNYKMLSETLITPLNMQPLYNVYLADKTVEEAVSQYSVYVDELLRSLNKEEFDYMLLGVGNDGHTASLFPGRNHFPESEQNAICGGVGPEGLERISLSPAALNKSRQISFLVNGPGKRHILELMKDDWNPDRYPIQNIKVPKNMYLLIEE